MTEKEIDLLADAIGTSAEIHRGQKDKGGHPYYRHPLRVGLSLLPDVDAAIVGVLHDTIEDCSYPGLGGRVSLAIDIYRVCGEKIHSAVMALTRVQSSS